MRIIIDRVEGNYAVVELENGTFENMPLSLIPNDAKEGNVLEILVNNEETENKRTAIKKKMDSLFKK